MLKSVCNTCIHFKPFNNIIESRDFLGTCSKFNDFAISCKEDETKCTVFGKYFIKKLLLKSYSRTAGGTKFQGGAKFEVLTLLLEKPDTSRDT